MIKSLSSKNMFYIFNVISNLPFIIQIILPTTQNLEVNIEYRPIKKYKTLVKNEMKIKSCRG